MTRRDFQLIAGVLADCETDALLSLGPEHGREIMEKIVSRFAHALAGTNPRFDAGRFERWALPIASREESPVK